jgi:hypothetical protein
VIATRARAWVGLAAGAVVLAVVVDASASSAIRPAPGAPDPRLMVLTSDDLGGAKVTDQGYYRDTDFPSVISYDRVLEGGRLGGTRLPYVDSQAEVGTSAATTARYLTALRTFLRTKQGRRLLAGVIEDELGEAGSVAVGRPRSLEAGPGSFDLRLTVTLLGQKLDAHVSAFRVERLLGANIAIGMPGKPIPLAVMTRLAKIMTARMKAELAPKLTAPPTVTGTAAVGQTLTATTGTWSGKPTGYAYQWQRCDAGGAACTSIAGATAQSYVVADFDIGATLRVAVTARNASGSATATSAPTAVVQATGAPVSTSPPTIAGTAQVGQTLTAGTGTWTGGPTSFGFQWQRCNASGAGCVDIGGATGGTYVVGSADVGSTLRVVVTATNSVGSATAASAPTAVVT